MASKIEKSNIGQKCSSIISSVSFLPQSDFFPLLKSNQTVTGIAGCLEQSYPGIVQEWAEVFVGRVTSFFQRPNSNPIDQPYSDYAQTAKKLLMDGDYLNAVRNASFAMCILQVAGFEEIFLENPYQSEITSTISNVTRLMFATLTDLLREIQETQLLS